MCPLSVFVLSFINRGFTDSNNNNNNNNNINNNNNSWTHVIKSGLTQRVADIIVDVVSDVLHDGEHSVEGETSRQLVHHTAHVLLLQTKQ